eukprot:COSAG01_NODE_3225_length_6386_cov_25.050581_2_plen_926_part_00
MLTSATDLAGAFDTCSLEGFDKALREALPAPWAPQEDDWLDTEAEGGPVWRTDTELTGQALQSVKVRNLYRMLYRDVQCMVRTKSANGETAYSHPYHPTRGGCQGSVWMPFLFLILAHYTYKRVDPGRSQIYGEGEDNGTDWPRCTACEKLFDPALVPTPDGECRGCQIIHCLPPKGNRCGGMPQADDADGDTLEDPARRLFQELDADNDSRLNEQELDGMVAAIWPDMEGGRRDDMVQDVIDIWGTMDEDTQELSIGLDEFKNAWTDLGGHTLWKSRARAPATGAARRAEERDDTADADAGATEPLTDTAASRVHAPIPDSDSDEEEDGDAETLYNDIRRANAHATLHRVETEEDQIFTKRRVQRPPRRHAGRDRLHQLVSRTNTRQPHHPRRADWTPGRRAWRQGGMQACMGVRVSDEDTDPELPPLGDMTNSDDEDDGSGDDDDDDDDDSNNGDGDENDGDEDDGDDNGDDDDGDRRGEAVEAICGTRLHNGAREFRVKWAGRPNSENTWLPHTRLSHCAEQLTAYNARRQQGEWLAHGTAVADAAAGNVTAIVAEGEGDDAEPAEPHSMPGDTLPADCTPARPTARSRSPTSASGNLADRLWEAKAHWVQWTPAPTPDQKWDSIQNWDRAPEDTPPAVSLEEESRRFDREQREQRCARRSGSNYRPHRQLWTENEPATDQEDMDWSVGLPAEDEAALDVIEGLLHDSKRMAPLVPASIEFADDQTLLCATQRFPGVPRERQLEEQMLARWAGRRLGICATGYKTEAGFDMEWAKNFSIWTRPPVKCPRVTNDALEALDLQYRCDGCGRPEASMATRMGHQRHCLYLLLIDTWENPEDSDGEWAVEHDAPHCCCCCCHACSTILYAMLGALRLHHSPNTSDTYLGGYDRPPRSWPSPHWNCYRPVTLLGVLATGQATAWPCS